ncbi:molybdenum cofactor guanylyltransferase MobA [Aquabacterium sp.]|uniref:molybdenum cofactor guanylyltransferase MobA n=1 Tax=Aquabacterium sp. TaxID=1872578 RepID=UPI001987578E|nr:molybdenum cofactor guanylyltransferase MobA [Aquabacterium sp.]MBC7701659.1 molybdenum cofactor guanylyltransferase [Aquabacterium sp.]
MPQSEVTGWILAGGEGRRMGGANKGLQPYQGQALASWVIHALRGQVSTLRINANRDLANYAQLLEAASAGGEVWPDDEGINTSLGPLAGILTGLRQVATPWLMVSACDTPALPSTLVGQLHQQALAHHANIAVPVTCDANGETRHHWTCALIHAHTRPSLEAALAQGERRVGQWIKSCAWIGVSFDDPAAFININIPETLHGPV